MMKGCSLPIPVVLTSQGQSERTKPTCPPPHGGAPGLGSLPKRRQVRSWRRHCVQRLGVLRQRQSVQRAPLTAQLPKKWEVECRTPLQGTRKAAIAEIGNKRGDGGCASPASNKCAKMRFFLENLKKCTTNAKKNANRVSPPPCDKLAIPKIGTAGNTTGKKDLRETKKILLNA